MSILDQLGLNLGPTLEEQKEMHRKIVERIMYGFNGEDEDTRAVHEFVDAYAKYIEAQYKGRSVSSTLGDALSPAFDGLANTFIKLEHLASFRLNAQDKCFTDPGGPDYEEAQRSNADNN